MIDEVRIKCRKCGRQALADEFVLDHDYKMMICPACVQEKRSSGKKRQAAAEKGVLDDSLTIEEAASPQQVQTSPRGTVADKKQPEMTTVQSTPRRIEPIPPRIQEQQKEMPLGSKVKINCSKCNYRFSYDPDRRFPSKCPYCGTPVGNA